MSLPRCCHMTNMRKPKPSCECGEPALVERLSFAVLHLSAKFRRPVWSVVEPEFRILRDRNPALDAQEQLVPLPNPDRRDKMRRHVKPRHLVHLHPGVIRVPD